MHLHQINLHCTLLLIACTTVLTAQTPGHQLEPFVQSKQHRTLKQSVLSPGLYSILGIGDNRKILGLDSLISETEIRLYHNNLRQAIGHDREIQIRILAKNISELIPELQSLAFQVTALSELHNRLVGIIPIDNLLQLQNLKPKGLIYAEEVLAPVNRVGSVTSQADTVMGTSQIRELMSGIDGTGVKIGVLSDSYDVSGGAAAGVISGDLPDSITVVEEDLTGNDEGRAMIELIHDLAPGAEICFATAFGGQENFAENIDSLAKLGCKVIVDDISYLSDPFFQNGIVAQKVNEVATNYGVSYFSSAGNEASRSYESTIINFVQPQFNYLGFYDFDPGPGEDIYNEFVLDSGENVRLSFQWDDPFYTMGNVCSDLDLYILDEDSVVVAFSTINNPVADIPLEITGYESDTTHTYLLQIGLWSGPFPGRIKAIDFGTGVPFEYEMNSPTIFGHPAADSAIAVGAVPYFNTTIPEPFTSAGPTTFLFNDDGSPKAMEIRNKPDIASIDGTNNTFFGFDIPDPDTFPNFFGTSAAAPHAAAIAALICQAIPAINPAELKQILQDGAIDLHDPGFDFLTGHGLINALSNCILTHFEITQTLLIDEFTPKKLRAIDSIEATGTILADSTFTFIASEEIVLSSEFEVLGELDAIIQSCQSN